MPEKTPAKPAAPKRKPRAAKPATPPVQPDLPNIPAPDPVPAEVGVYVSPVAAVLSAALRAGDEVTVHADGVAVTGLVAASDEKRGVFVISEPHRHVVVFDTRVTAVAFRSIPAAASAIGANDPA